MICELITGSSSEASEWFKVAVQADGKQRKLDELFARQSSGFKKARTSLGTAVPLMDLIADDNDDDEVDDEEEDDPEVAAASNESLGTTTTTTSKPSRKKRSQHTLSVPPVGELATGSADINSGNRRSGRSRTNRMAMMIQVELGHARVNTDDIELEVEPEDEDYESD